MPGYLGNDPAGSATKIARQTYTTSGAATTDFTFTSGYDVGYLDVYINGVRQTKGTNFTASDGSTFRVLNGGVGAGSTVEATAYKTFNLATVDFDDLGNTGNLTLSGDISAVNATFSGNVSIAGTLTYEDVENIDSVGVITARSGVDILSGGIDIVGNTTGLNVTGVGTFVDVNVSGVATVAGDLVISDKIVHSGDTNTAIRFRTNDVVTVETGGEERTRVTTTGLGIGTDNPTEKLHVFNRTSNGGLIHYDGASNSHFGLRIRSNSDGGNFESDFANGTTAMLDLFADSGTVSGGDFLVCRSQDANPILLVKGNGRLGIGTADPQNIIDIHGTGHDKIIIGSTGTGNAVGLQIIHAKGNAAQQMWQVQTDASADGNLKIRNATDNADTVFLDADTNNVAFVADINVAGVATATQLFEGSTRVATSGKAIAMALIFG